MHKTPHAGRFSQPSSNRPSALGTPSPTTTASAAFTAPPPRTASAGRRRWRCHAAGSGGSRRGASGCRWSSCPQRVRAKTVPWRPEQASPPTCRTAQWLLRRERAPTRCLTRRSQLTPSASYPDLFLHCCPLLTPAPLHPQARPALLFPHSRTRWPVRLQTQVRPPASPASILHRSTQQRPQQGRFAWASSPTPRREPAVLTPQSQTQGFVSTQLELRAGAGV